MTDALPPELDGLLNGGDPAEREAAWVRFIENHHKLLLHATRSLGGDRDAAMNRYVYVLEKLRQDDYRRLRAYSETPRCAFTTWLVIVARRLSIDHERERFGRAPAQESRSAADRRTLRRRLVEGLYAAIDPASLHDAGAPDPEQAAYLSECREALSSALGSLDPDDRLLLKLRIQDGLPAPEIADLLGLPTRFHVYRRVNSLCAGLRRELRARGIEAPA